MTESNTEQVQSKSQSQGQGRDAPFKVVYFNPTGTLGGAELCLLDVVAGVRAGRPEWSIKVLLADDGPVRSALERLGIDCDVLPIPSRLAAAGDSDASSTSPLRKLLRLSTTIPSTLGYFLKVRRALRAEGADLLQTNGMKAHLLGAWGAPRGLPVVWQMHDYPGSRPLMARLLKLSRRRGLRVVAVSRSVADDTKALLGPSVPVECIYNAIDIERFSPVEPSSDSSDVGEGHAAGRRVDFEDDPGAWLDELAGLPPARAGTVRVGLVATYARWKGHDLFLDAASRVSVTPSPPVRFYVVGGPIYRSAGSQFSLEELEAKANSLGLGGRIGFVPHQGEPAEVFQSLDVVVHASTRPEPFGRVIVEAMACGRALVAMQAGGAAELFEDGVSALGAPPNDPDALADRLSRLIASIDLRASLGREGRKAAIAYFDRNRLGSEWIRAYQAFW